ncbi:M15 family metallopeptidase [Metabacillus fastidiosus]|uniref:M15 family metallopeptidase n=1 Tax=Metabacillus fastidiosus TaxID=1458 RepID=A0ABU6NRG3_9BACI|nr:M15 family metallopeptidase [Metabacillus fastidiosus]
MTDVTKTCRDISQLDKVAQEACNLFLNECKEAGVDIFITETYRSQARQDYLYAQGRTRSGQKVTWTRNSRHTNRLAWDIAVNKPKDLYDVAILKQAGTIAKKLGITWGGNWSTPDMPHFEVTKDWVAPVVKDENNPKGVVQEVKVSESIQNAINKLASYDIMAKDYKVTKDYEVPVISMMNNLVKAIESGRLKEK